MKNFDEYSKSVFEKRDRIIIQRRKRIKATAVSLCTVVAVSLSAFAIGNHFAANEFENSTDSAESAQNVTEYSANALADEAGNKKAEDFEAYPVQDSVWDDAFSGHTEILDSNIRVSEIVPENAPEIAVTNQSLSENDAFPDIATEPFLQNGADGIPAASDKDKPEENKSHTLKQYTNEEIIDAAFKALDSERKSKADKNRAEIMVEHKSTGENSYIVMFETKDGGYVKIKLNSETLEKTE